jgi:subtilisin family serine protease
VVLLLCGCAKQPSQEQPPAEKKREIRVAVIDTGISTQAVSAEHLAEGANYLLPESNTEDTYGHGTAVASVILAHAPDALLIPLVSNVYSKGKISFVDNDTFARMIRDAVDVYHCDIINISAGLVLDKQAIREAIDYAEEQGVPVLASAGNDYAENPGQIYYPAAYESVLAVGSLTADGTAIAEFSQRGEWVDLFAPGEEILVSTLSGGQRTEKGSSYATARVTAAAVVCLQQTEQMTPSELRRHLLETPSLFGGIANVPGN